LIKEFRQVKLTIEKCEPWQHEIDSKGDERKKHCLLKVLKRELHRLERESGETRLLSEPLISVFIHDIVGCINL
jgi:hypothetical protein